MFFCLFLYLFFFYFSLLQGMNNSSDSFEELSGLEEIFIDDEPNFPLHVAVLQGDLEKVKQYVQNDFDCNAFDDSHETPLHTTRFIINQKTRYPIMEFLLQNKADPNINYVYFSDHGRLQELLNIMSGSSGNKTVLLNHYIKENYIEEVKLLLTHKANPTTHLSLHEVVRYIREGPQIKSPELVELVLQHGADVNQRDKKGDTPLHRCIKNSDFFFNLDNGFLKFKSLLAYDADIGSQDSDGNTIFHQENFWKYCGEECLEKAQKTLITMLILRKQKKCPVRLLSVKPLFFSIIKLANPCYAILNPAFNGILIKKNNQSKTAYELATQQYVWVKQQCKGNHLVSVYEHQKGILEKAMKFLKPREN